MEAGRERAQRNREAALAIRRERERAQEGWRPGAGWEAAVDPRRVTFHGDASAAREVLDGGAPPPSSRCVVLWMSAAQRAEWNHALELALTAANRSRLPALALFVLTDAYPEANLRHYTFMLEGLPELRDALEARGVALAVMHATAAGGGVPGAVAAVCMRAGAALLVTDRAYLRVPRGWRQDVAARLQAEGGPAVVEVETDAVVPVDVASSAREHSAAAFRPKIASRVADFLIPVPRVELAGALRRAILPEDVAASGQAAARTDARGEEEEEQGLGDGRGNGPRLVQELSSALAQKDGNAKLGPDEAVAAVLARLDVDRSVKACSWAFPGGRRAALARMDKFLRTMLSTYAASRNDPSAALQSHQAPYLQYGMVSPLELALAARAWVAGSAASAGTPQGDALRAGNAMFFEELVVRRELAINHCWYARDAYDTWDVLPAWARATLEAHEDDFREALYDEATLEGARTGDPVWNAAQRQMTQTGKMHNYLRMYWAKRLIEWVQGGPREALRVALWLNNKWSLDGRGPASFTGVLWCFGLHDREFPERRVFGGVRTLTSAGMQRKFGALSVKGYVDRHEAAASRGGSSSPQGTAKRGRQPSLHELFGKRRRLGDDT